VIKRHLGTNISPAILIELAAIIAFLVVGCLVSTIFARQTVAGLAEGAVFGSLALALVLIYRATEVINFAQGEMAMATTYVAFQLTKEGLSYWEAFFLTLAIAFVFGSVIQVLLIRPVQRRSPIAVVIVTYNSAHVIGDLLDSLPRALDGLTADVRDGVRREIERQLPFLAFAHFHFISALKGTGIAALMRSVDAAHAAAFAKLSTPRLTRILRAAVEKQQPPRRGMSRPKMRYAHQGGQNPPVVIIHGSGLGAVPDTYRRYLIGQFRDAFALRGTPLKVEFRSSRNPYAPER